VIRFAYATYSGPPAPFVYVTVRCPQLGTTSQESPAQIDTAADCTVIPGNLVDALQLVEVGQKRVGGLGGHIHLLPVYRADVAIRSMPAVRVLLLRGDNEPFILLGRDVLNHFRTLLDGPGLAAEVS